MCRATTSAWPAVRKDNGFKRTDTKTFPRPPSGVDEFVDEIHARGDSPRLRSCRSDLP
jgi:hypothetical protein